MRSTILIVFFRLTKDQKIHQEDESNIDSKLSQTGLQFKLTQNPKFLEIEDIEFQNEKVVFKSKKNFVNPLSQNKFLEVEDLNKEYLPNSKISQQNIENISLTETKNLKASQAQEQNFQKVEKAPDSNNNSNEEVNSGAKRAFDRLYKEKEPLPDSKRESVIEDLQPEDYPQMNNNELFADAIAKIEQKRAKEQLIRIRRRQLNMMNRLAQEMELEMNKENQKLEKYVAEVEQGLKDNQKRYMERQIEIALEDNKLDEEEINQLKKSIIVNKNTEKEIEELIKDNSLYLIELDGFLKIEPDLAPQKEKNREQIKIESQIRRNQIIKKKGQQKRKSSIIKKKKIGIVRKKNSRGNTKKKSVVFVEEKIELNPHKPNIKESQDILEEISMSKSVKSKAKKSGDNNSFFDN